MRAILVVTLTLCLVLPAGGPASTQGHDDRITVYVFTQTHPAGLNDTNQAGRLEAVEGLKRALGKKKAIRVVEEGEGSDMEVEVTLGGKHETGNLITLTRADGMGSRTTKERGQIVHVHMRVGDYSLELEGTGLHRRVSLSKISKDLAYAIDQWIKQNRQVLAQRRTSQRCRSDVGTTA